jgi:hypothetical protein
MRKLVSSTALALVLSIPLAAAPPDENSHLTLKVLTEEGNKPVASAHIVVRFINGKKLLIKDKRTSWEAQTNKKGELEFDDIPLGNIKVQVIARGYQTFGGEFDVKEPDQELTIRLKPPAKQVSAY